MLKKLIFISLVTLPFLLHSQVRNTEKADALVTPRLASKILSVGGEEADIQGFSNQSIQLAIDAVSLTGGTVKLDPGQYEAKAPVRLKSNVHLVGAGDKTVLRRDRGVQTPFVVDADFGELKVTVENTDGFEIGMKVQVTDENNSSCWNVSTAYITDISDNTLYIDKGLIRDYRSDKNGMVSNASSIIEVIDAQNASVSNLTLDGNREENYFADGCNSAGVLILRSKHVTINKVKVLNFNGEGISWQITENVSVKNSEISGSGNTGLHPGTGSPFSIIENNNVHHNDRDGLFICWRVYKSLVKGNAFHNNGRFGICTGHKDTDVIFDDNHVFENGDDGIHLRGERESNAPHRNTFVRNIIENNGTDGGGYGFSVNSPAADLVLENNKFKNSRKTQKAAVYIQSNGLMPSLKDNSFDFHELGNVLQEK